MTLRIGVDLGGTKIEAIALDGSGTTLARHRVDTPAGDYPATVRAVVDLVATVEKAVGGSGTVGVGIPGAISPATGRVKNANSTWLIGQALDADLTEALDRPVRLANDADCFALSEATDGAAAGASLVFGVILGTGVGGGIVVNGRPVSGPNAIAGEWGHNPLPAPTDDERPGPPCYCGRSGCIETWLSGPGLAADHARTMGETLTAAAIADRASAGDRGCIATLERHAGRLAKALAGVINVLDPHVIVLGGGLSNMAHLYDRVPALWRTHVFSDRVDTRLVPPVHGDSSGVRGAAWLWPA
ncbi:ROK family protein [Caenispirillum salinarum]|uniref:ROK family protein n=1 Tax=Caenispirillum salinarum TaxID=859058 RepID=UPI00384C98C6